MTAVITPKLLKHDRSLFLAHIKSETGVLGWWVALPQVAIQGPAVFFLSFCHLQHVASRLTILSCIKPVEGTRGWELARGRFLEASLGWGRGQGEKENSEENYLK